MIYSHRNIEKKWQKIWYETNLFSPDWTDFKKPKFYLLDMFPYPSGSGLHVGHLRGYLGTDILTRMKMMQGFNVFHPIGFDSFGLPAEQYAIKTKKDPNIFTNQNIDVFLNQLQSFGFAYDYQRIIKTHEPNYYQWTQWTFLQMYKKDLIKEKDKIVNFCPKLNTVLANEEVLVIDNRTVSERGNHPVFKTNQKQWVIEIPKYGEKLLSGLKTLDWPEFIKKEQINWIGKTEGYQFDLQLLSENNLLKKIDSFISIFSNDYFLVDQAEFILINLENKKLDQFLKKSDLEKLKKIRNDEANKFTDRKEGLNKNPLGIEANLFVQHPWKKIFLPIYFVKYVDSEFAYGTQFGSTIINLQDWFFAFHNKVIPSLQLENNKIKFDNHQKEIQSDQTTLWKIKKTIFPFFSKTFYHLRDWIFSRQRYWGEPFPLKKINNKWTPLDEKDLPLLLPSFDERLFDKKGNKTPLANLSEWTEANYNVNTMPQWAGSCWYFLAYLLKQPDNTFLPLQSLKAQKILNHWLPVDLYVGGQEHAVLHLLYARFWNIFLTDIDCLKIKEPFQKLLNQGLILAMDGKKMSKSKGNVVNPNDFLISHGADAMRLHINFMGPFSQKIYWNEKTLDSMRKWLARVYRLFIEDQKIFISKETPQFDTLYAKTVKKVTFHYENCQFNSAISELMTFINFCYKNKKGLININYGFGFLKLLHPLAPHLTQEIWTKLGKKDLIVKNKWPSYDEKFLEKKNINIALQINGKTKKILSVKVDSSKENIIEKIKNELNFKINDKMIIKIVFIKNKIINFVLK